MAAIKSSGKVLVHADTHAPVNYFDTVTAFDGEAMIVTGGQPPQRPGTTGRIFVTTDAKPDTDTPSADFYPGVFNTVWIREDTLPDGVDDDDVAVPVSQDYRVLVRGYVHATATVVVRAASEAEASDKAEALARAPDFDWGPQDRPEFDCVEGFE